MVKRVITAIMRVLAAVALAGSGASAAELKVGVTNAMEEAQLELATAFERTTGHKVVTVWGGTDALAKRVADGEAFDVLIIARSNLDRLMSAGKLLPGSRREVARSGIGVAIRSGLAKPEIATAEQLKQAVLHAKSVAYSAGPSGYYLADLFRHMGIARQIRNKVLQAPSGTQVGHLVGSGKADLGFQQISELMHVPGIDFLGPLPAEIQHYTVFAAGVPTSAPVADAAQAYVSFITGPEAAPILRKIGMEPAFGGRPAAPH